MNKQFRIAQRFGLMFRYDQDLPQDMEAWIGLQLQAPSPALGIANTSTEVAEWPDGGHALHCQEQTYAGRLSDPLVTI